MMPVNIWGFDPKTGEAALYAFCQPADELKNLLKAAKAAGWKGLVSSPTTPSPAETELKDGEDDGSEMVMDYEKRGA